MPDIYIQRTGRSDEVFLQPKTPSGRSWLQSHFGQYANYGHRMQLDASDLRAFEEELGKEGITFE